jgi:hypothetical protein
VSLIAAAFSLILAPSPLMAGRNVSGSSFSFNQIFHTSPDYYSEAGMAPVFRQ